jgi:predicted MFS family arabinose efflux permease
VTNSPNVASSTGSTIMQAWGSTSTLWVILLACLSAIIVIAISCRYYKNRHKTLQ